MNENRDVAVTLTTEECKAIYDLIDQLSGGNAGNVFSGYNDPLDPIDPDDPTITSCAKIFGAAGENVPNDGEEVEDPGCFE